MCRSHSSIKRRSSAVNASFMTHIIPPIRTHPVMTQITQTVVMYDCPPGGRYAIYCSRPIRDNCRCLADDTAGGGASSDRSKVRSQSNGNAQQNCCRYRLGQSSCAYVH